MTAFTIENSACCSLLLLQLIGSQAARQANEQSGRQTSKQTGSQRSFFYAMLAAGGIRVQRKLLLLLLLPSSLNHKLLPSELASERTNERTNERVSEIASERMRSLHVLGESGDSPTTIAQRALQWRLPKAPWLTPPPPVTTRHCRRCQTPQKPIFLKKPV